ncbi:MAG: hypothetical protein OR993_06170, partial [Candidatus Poseidoniales archaeon]|nr:hypothetical protein [Candidatus Poseidoniales archaeon]
MLDEQSEHKQERSSQLAVAVGLLLFASVVLGSGVLGDAGDSRLVDGDEAADDSGADRTTDREMALNDAEVGRDGEMAFSWQDCRGTDRPLDSPTDDEPRDAAGETDRDTQTDRPNSADTPRTPMTGTATTAAGAISFTAQPIDRDSNLFEVRDGQMDCGGMGDSAMLIGFGAMNGPANLQPIIRQMCDSFIHQEFFANLGEGVVRTEDGFEITTIDDAGNEVTETISRASIQQLTHGLGPLVDACTAMMMAMVNNAGMGMGGGMGHGNDHGGGWGDWDDDCYDEDEWIDWDDDNWEHDSDDYEHEDSDEANDAHSDDSLADDEPRDSRHDEQTDRRHGDDWNPCGDRDDWDGED